MSPPRLTRVERESGRQDAELLMLLSMVGVFLAVAVPAVLRAAKQQGLSLREAAPVAFSAGIAALALVWVGLALVGRIVGWSIERRSPKVGKEMKVPCGRFKGLRGVVEALPQEDGLVRMRLPTTGELLLLPQWLFGDARAFDAEEYAWLAEGARVHVHGIYQCGGSVEKVDADRLAVLVRMDGKADAVWLSPNFLEESPKQRTAEPPLDDAPPQAQNLTCDSRVLESSNRGCVLEFVFRGVHVHTHGPVMSRFIEATIKAHAPVAAVVVNLLDYDYKAGNDIAQIFVGFMDRHTRELRPSCVVATGRTHSSLYRLFEIGRLLTAFRLRFVTTVEDALQWIRSELER